MDYVEIEIDSTLATISDSSLSPLDNPVINIGRTLTNIVGAKVMEVNIPFSCYPITDQINADTNLPENRFLVQTLSGIGSFNITIPAGFYTATTLAAAMQTQFAAGIALAINYVVDFTAPTTATVVYNSVTGKFIFTATQTAPAGPTDLQLVFSSGTSLHPLARLLGFTSNTVQFTTSLADTVFTLTPSNIASVTGPNILYVNSRLLGNICKAYLPQSSLVTGETNPQMAMIPINVNPGGIIWWQDPNPEEVFDTRNLFSLQSLDLYMTWGTDPRPLRFNGLGFQVKLVLYVKSNSQGLSQSGTLSQNRAIMKIRPT